MKPEVTKGIVLSRTDFGEADRILKVLTPGAGKLRLMARGVRRLKSKLAGGIELFSVSDITYLRGKGEIGTLMSTRLVDHYAGIVQDLERVQLGYDLIKMLDKATEDLPEPDYFNLLQMTFESLDDKAVKVGLIKLWFQAQLLRLAGHMPNLMTDDQGHKLDAKQSYGFDLESMAFTVGKRFSSNHIKLLRLLFNQNSPRLINQVESIDHLLPKLQPLISGMSQTHLGF